MYELTPDPSKDGSGKPSKKIQFNEVYAMESSGATDMEHFTIDGYHFLAISNEGDIQNQKDQVSRIYCIMTDIEEREADHKYWKYAPQEVKEHKDEL